MTKTRAKNAVEKLNDNGIEASLYEGYSGRGMYGRETDGVALKNAHDFGAACAICPGLAKASRDSLGLGTIIY